MEIIKAIYMFMVVFAVLGFCTTISRRTEKIQRREIKNIAIRMFCVFAFMTFFYLFAASVILTLP